MFLLDTNTLSFLRVSSAYPSLKNKAKKLWKQCLTSSITRGEVIFGLERMPEGKRKEVRSEEMHALLNYLPLVVFDAKCADVFGKMKYFLEKKGQIIEDMDLMIASVALANDLTLVTDNTKHFERIKGLKLENWLE